VKRGGLLQESPCFLSRKGQAQKNGVLGESLAAINGQQGEDWGKNKDPIPKNVKRKYLHPCRPFFWRTCSPSCQECRFDPVVL